MARGLVPASACCGGGGRRRLSLLLRRAALPLLLTAALLPACAGDTAAVPATGESCDDGVDNNADGQIDCADPLCQQACQDKLPPDPSGRVTPPWPSCATETGDRSHTPVDIIWTVDSSFSMTDEMGWIQENINQFVEHLTLAKLDVRVVVLGGQKICVPQPLAGPDCGDGERYRHVNEYVGSHDGLKQIIALHPRYKDFIRPQGKKVLIITTDDNSEVGAEWFNQAVASLATPGFPDGFVFHSIVSYGTHPKGCLTGAAPGSVYLALTEQTGGIKVPICQTDWSAVFAQLSANVASMVALPCSYQASGVPEGSQVSSERVQVNTSTAAGVWSTPPRRANAAECGADGGWYVDAATATVHLCPATCQAEDLRQVEVLFGCIEDIG